MATKKQVKKNPDAFQTGDPVGKHRDFEFVQIFDAFSSCTAAAEASGFEFILRFDALVASQQA